MAFFYWIQMDDLTGKYVGKVWRDASGELMSPNLAFLLNEIDNYNIFVLSGGARCFCPSQKVITKRGSIPISEIAIGDIIKCYNEQTLSDEWKPVLDVTKFQNDKSTIRIRLKNGEEIICNADHKFFYKGRWIAISDILKSKKWIIKY